MYWRSFSSRNLSKFVGFPLLLIVVAIDFVALYLRLSKCVVLFRAFFYNDLRELVEVCLD